jgi:hypothetical protein
MSFFEGCIVMICRIVAIGFELFPANLETVWPWFLAFLFIYFLLNLISTFIVLKLKCMHPKLK